MGLYSVPGNWSTAEVPYNNGTVTWNVIIPNDRTVTYDLVAPTEITGFNPRRGSTFLMDTGEQFVVNGVAVLSGSIDARAVGTYFEAMSPFTVFSEDSARALARDGAVIRIGAASITNNYWEATDYFLADGPGSRIELPGLAAMTHNRNNYFGDAYRPGVIARNEGAIDFSALTTITGGINASQDWRFIAQSGGEIRLPKLTLVSR